MFCFFKWMWISLFFPPPAVSRSERPITSTSGSSPGPTPRSEPRGFPAPNYSHLAVTKIHASVPTSVNLYSDTSAEEEWGWGGSLRSSVGLRLWGRVFQKVPEVKVNQWSWPAGTEDEPEHRHLYWLQLPLIRPLWPVESTTATTGFSCGLRSRTTQRWQCHLVVRRRVANPYFCDSKRPAIFPVGTMWKTWRRVLYLVPSFISTLYLTKVKCFNPSFCKHPSEGKQTSRFHSNYSHGLITKPRHFNSHQSKTLTNKPQTQGAIWKKKIRTFGVPLFDWRRSAVSIWGRVLSWRNRNVFQLAV